MKRVNVNRSMSCFGCVLAAGLMLVGSARARAEEPTKMPKVKTLLFVGGPIHDHKAIGKEVEKQLNEYGRFAVTKVEEDLDALKAENLKPFDLVIFYYTLGTITEEQKRGVMNFVKDGKGFVAFHSGADSFRGDPDWDAFVGGHFIGHPAYRPYKVTIRDHGHPVTAGLKDFTVTDEQYFLCYDSRVNVLCTGPGKDEAKDKPMPVAWTKPWGKGRVFYTGMGHDAKACSQKMFQTVLCRGALWAAGQECLDRQPRKKKAGTR